MLTSHISCAASSSFSRRGPSRVTFPSLSLRNSMKATGYTYASSGSASYTNMRIHIPWSHAVGDRVRFPLLARAYEG
jgi:hypothetical protein